MTGLNFQTLTIINYNGDPDSKKGSKLFEGKQGKVDGVLKDILSVKRDFVFVKEGVQAIRKKAGYVAEMCEASIDFTNLVNSLKPKDASKNYCRLDIYLGVEGAEPYIYATPWVQKGIPFWIEFTVDGASTATTVASDIAKIIKKDHIFQHGKDLIEVSDNGAGKLTLKGADEFQRFRKIEINMFKASDDYSEKMAEMNTSAGPIKLEKAGKNSFGTYSQIIKDLKLPTAANTQWAHIRQAETPIVGAIYDQYIIEYAAPATNGGMHCVGQRMESHTSHVFWVRHDTQLIQEWETALGKIDPDGGTLDTSNVKASVDTKISKIEATIKQNHP